MGGCPKRGGGMPCVVHITDHRQCEVIGLRPEGAAKLPLTRATAIHGWMIDAARPPCKAT